MKTPRLSNTVLLAFLLASTHLLLAEEDKTSDRCGVCHEQETNDWEASKDARRAGGLGATGYVGSALTLARPHNELGGMKRRVLLDISGFIGP